MRPKHLAKVAAKSVFALIDPLFGPLPGPRILIYHQVGTDLGREMEVPTETFKKQLDWMQSHGEIVDLETAIERWDEPAADKLFVLTFDDGFEDVYRNAFPIMKERGIPFTLYLTTNPIETGEPLDPRYPEAKPLTWDQVNEMIGTGLVTVGAHTHTHPDLTQIGSDQAVEELDTSNRLIEERTGARPMHFTYPWGWWSEAADAVVRDRYASATVGDAPGSTAVDDWRLPRIPIQRSDLTYFSTMKMRGEMRVESIVRSAVEKRRTREPVPPSENGGDADEPPLVFHIIDSLTSTGGAESRLVEEVVRMKDVRSVVIRLYERDDLDGALQSYGIPVVHLGLKSDRNAAQLLLGAYRLRSLLQKRRPVVVHSSLFAGNLVAQLATATVRPLIPVLSTLTRIEDKRVEGLLFNRQSRGIRRTVVAWLGSRARSQAHVSHRAVSGAVRESAIEYLKLDPDRIVALPRGVRAMDTNHIDVSPETLGLPPGPLILNIGRLSAPKGQIHLVRAFSHVLEVLPSAQLAIAGEAQDAAAEIQHEVSSCGLSESVHFLGHRSDVAELLCFADVVCQPSVSEGMPGVVLEAMAAGRPVVAFDIPAVREVAGASGVELVAVRDEVGLAAGIVRLLTDQHYASSLGARGREIANRFDANRVADNLKALLLELGGVLDRPSVSPS